MKWPAKASGHGAAPFPPGASKVFGPARAGAVKTAGSLPIVRRVVHANVAGFARYRNDVASLPSEERRRIDRLARLVVETHVSRSHPINAIRVIGHSDFDTPRRPIFETHLSAQRALSVMLALRAAIDRYGTRLTDFRAPLSRQIKWQRLAVGATMPAVTKPGNEAERLRNRRVDILLESERPLAPSKQAFARIPPHKQALVPQITQRTPTCIDPSPTQTALISPRPNTSFDVSVLALAFNPSTVGTIQQVMVAGSNTITAMRFSCHRVIASNGCLDVIPAWRFGANFNATLPASESAGDWEIGFMQTVVSSNIRHVYTGGTHQCIISTPTRDAVAGSQLPWFEGRFTHPLDGGQNPVLEDSPRTEAQLRRPALGELRKVCLEGVYQIWLAVRKARPAPAPPILLIFKEIQVGRSWTLISGRSPNDAMSWVHRGGQREIRVGNGNNKTLPGPVLANPTANDSVVKCFRDVPGVVSLCPDPAEFPNLCIKGVTCPAVR